MAVVYINVVNVIIYTYVIVVNTFTLTLIIYDIGIQSRMYALL